jgi:hypothetical protein
MAFELNNACKQTQKCIPITKAARDTYHIYLNKRQPSSSSRKCLLRISSTDSVHDRGATSHFSDDGLGENKNMLHIEVCKVIQH